MSHDSLILGSEEPAIDLSGYSTGLPHRLLRGQTRSLITFTPAMFDMLDDVLCFIEVSNGKPDADDGVAVQFNTDQCIAEIRAAARVARRLREIMKGAAQ